MSNEGLFFKCLCSNKSGVIYNVNTFVNSNIVKTSDLHIEVN